MITNLFDINTIRIIETIPEGRGRTGKNLFLALPFALLPGGEPFKPKYELANNKKELFDYLDKIADEIHKFKIMPIIHIEAHGNEKGIDVGEEDFVKWFELVEKFKEINLRMCNNLFVVMSACEGVNLQKIFTEAAKSSGSLDRSPIFAFIGSPNEIAVKNAQDDFLRFYNKLLETNNNTGHKNLNEAFEALKKNGTDYRFISCLGIFIRHYPEMLKKIDSNKYGDTIIERVYNKARDKFFMIDICSNNAIRFPLPFSKIREIEKEFQRMEKETVETVQNSLTLG